MINQQLMRQMQQYRRDLHQIPELGFDLYKTHAYVKDVLKGMGYEVVTVANTGILVHIQGKHKEAICFRADMDGLSITEQNDVSYKSLHDGVMHACGHDGHMAMLLGLAEFLLDQPRPNKSIVLLFQPAEEGPGGAKVIVDSGILARLDVTQIYGIHLYPHLQKGLLGLTDGLMMSEISEYDVQIKGLGAHGAEPEKGIDAIKASIDLIERYKDIIQNAPHNKTKTILNIGTLHAGETRNSVAETATFTGTVRTLSQVDYQYITSEMAACANDIAQSHRVEVSLDIKNYYPPVINDHNLYESLTTSLSKRQYKIIDPLMVSEDFAFYQESMPGLFMLLGTNVLHEQAEHPLHSAHFDFDDSVLIEGIHTYLHLLSTHGIISPVCYYMSNSDDVLSEKRRP